MINGTPVTVPELGSQTIEFPPESRGTSVISSPKAANFRVFSP
jgi:hypothetical protein